MARLLQAGRSDQFWPQLLGSITGINDVTVDRVGARSTAVYDLQGRRVADRLDDATRNSLPAGIYIVGGRKMVVK